VKRGLAGLVRVIVNNRPAPLAWADFASGREEARGYLILGSICFDAPAEGKESPTVKSSLASDLGQVITLLRPNAPPIAPQSDPQFE
jgi:hypothetical protein